MDGWIHGWDPENIKIWIECAGKGITGDLLMAPAKWSCRRLCLFDNLSDLRRSGNIVTRTFVNSLISGMLLPGNPGLHTVHTEQCGQAVPDAYGLLPVPGAWHESYCLLLFASVDQLHGTYRAMQTGCAPR
jgi:hypothetical protein